MKTALVLGGGGGKGAYEVGVWKALDEMGAAGVFSVVVGTSAGALNAALFAQGKLAQAGEVWSGINHDLILSKGRGFPHALYSQTGLRGLLEQHVGPFSREIDAYVCCTRIASRSGRVVVFGTDLEEEYEAHFVHLNPLPTSECIDYLMASSCMPFAYSKVEIHGAYYRDGGILPAYNVPWRKAVELGCGRVLAVSLGDGSPVTRKWEDNAKILILRPSVCLGDLFSGTLDFDGDSEKWRMELGYEDALHQRDTILQFLGM